MWIRLALLLFGGGIIDVGLQANQIIMKLLKYLKGKKTYLVAGIVFVLGGLEALGYAVPQELYVLLGGLGLYTLRSAIK